MSRFNFKKDVKYDIALFSEIELQNPFSVSTNNWSNSWDAIANSLQSSNLKMKVTGRLRKERALKLLKEFIANEQLSIKR